MKVNYFALLLFISFTGEIFRHRHHLMKTLKNAIIIGFVINSNLLKAALCQKKA